MTILAIFVLAPVLVDALADFLNVRLMNRTMREAVSRGHGEVPEEFRGIYDPERYRSSLQYQKDGLRAETIRKVVLTPLTLAFIFLGGLDLLDRFAVSLVSSADGAHPIREGLVFVGAISVLQGLVALPFSIHRTFVIEERYGFNRTTPLTFLLDLLKGALVGTLIGGPALAGVLWFFGRANANTWWICWLSMMALQLALVFVAPAVLMPLFNRFEKLPDGDLKSAIDQYTARQDFSIEGVYTMDGSKRSTRSNAFFTGFGKLRRLVLFDTLIAKQSVEELTAVVAHEIGHFKRGHILKSLGLSALITGFMFFGLSWILGNAELVEALGMRRPSVQAALVLAAILYSPFLKLFSIFSHWLSRRAEFEADDWSVRTYGHAGALASALKKLSAENLSNLTPHPLKIWLDYTHPPVRERVAAILRAEGRS